VPYALVFRDEPAVVPHQVPVYVAEPAVVKYQLYFAVPRQRGGL